MTQSKSYTTEELNDFKDFRNRLIKDNKRLNYKILAATKDPFFHEEDDEFTVKYNTPDYINACKEAIAHNNRLIKSYEKILEENGEF